MLEAEAQRCRPPPSGNVAHRIRTSDQGTHLCPTGLNDRLKGTNAVASGFVEADVHADAGHPSDGEPDVELHKSGVISNRLVGFASRRSLLIGRCDFALELA